MSTKRQRNRQRNYVDPLRPYQRMMVEAMAAGSRPMTAAESWRETREHSNRMLGGHIQSITIGGQTFEAVS